jgi:hypothetical protein
MHGVLRVLLLAGMAVPASCTPPGTADEPSPDFDRKRPAAARATLAAIEARLAPPYRQGEARFDHLWAYFQDANPALLSHLEQQVRRFENGLNHGGITCIAGPAGTGKSYVIRQLGLPEAAATQPIKLAARFEATAPDLQTLDGAYVFNVLPTADTRTLEALLETGEASSKAFVLLDDLDEIHADTALRLLQVVETFVQTRTDRPVHVLVFGRPEAFWPRLAQRSNSPPSAVPHRFFLLQGPDFQTTGDLRFRCRDYYQWQHQQEAPAAVVTALLATLDSNPFLRPSFRPLAGGNFILDSVIAAVDNGAGARPSAEWLRRELFDRYLERNHRSHGRPGPGNARYRRLLQDAAVFPLRHDRPIDAHGYFEVHPTDSLPFVDLSGELCFVPLQNLLDRSGVALLDLDRLDRRYYRFDPLWLHAALIEAWLDR